MSGDAETLRLMEVILTAEIFNRHPDLTINDLTPACREICAPGGGGASSIRRPVAVSEGAAKRTL